MEATAKLRFAKISVRKARMVLDMVRGQDVASALDQLRFTRKAAAPVVGKLIDSAIANAQQRDDTVKLDRLFVKTAFADDASSRMMMRWRPRAQGRATPIRKGLSHLTVILGERAAKPGAQAAAAPAAGKRTPKAAEAPKQAAAPAPTTKTKKRGTKKAEG